MRDEASSSTRQGGTFALLVRVAVAASIGAVLAVAVALLLAMYGSIPSQVTDYHLSVEPPRVAVLHRGAGLRLERLNGFLGMYGDPEGDKEALRLHKEGMPTARTRNLKQRPDDVPAWAALPPPSPDDHPTYQNEAPWRVWGAGWPFVSLRCSVPGDFPTPMFAVMVGHRIFKSPKLAPDTSLERKYLAELRPWWPGFLLNTLIYAAATWLLLFVGVRHGVRFVRRRRGRCPRCGYELAKGKLSACPECGWGRERG
jgi:hypothetical protein